MRSPKPGSPGSARTTQTLTTESVTKDRASVIKDKVDLDEDLSQAFGKISLGKESERTPKNEDVEEKQDSSATTVAKETVSNRDKEAPSATTVVDSAPATPKRASNPARS